MRLAQRSRIVLLAATGWTTKPSAPNWGSPARRLGAGAAGLRSLAWKEFSAKSSGAAALRRSANRRRAAIVRKTLDEKPVNATQWSRALMSAEADVSPSTVGRIWRVHGLKPHLVKTFKLSNDKRFAEKLEDVVGTVSEPARQRDCAVAATRKVRCRRWTARSPGCR